MDTVEQDRFIFVSGKIRLGTLHKTFGVQLLDDENIEDGTNNDHLLPDAVAAAVEVTMKDLRKLRNEVLTSTGGPSIGRPGAAYVHKE